MGIKKLNEYRFPNSNNGNFWLVYESNTTTSTVVDIVKKENDMAFL